MEKIFNNQDKNNKYTKTAITIIGVLTVVNTAMIGYAAYERTRDLSFKTPYPLVDVSRNFIPQEHFIVNIQSLREELNALVGAEKVLKVSLYFEFLNTGANISINSDFKVWPASLFKVPMSMAVMKKIERGEWSLNTELALFEEDGDNAYGDLWERPIDTRLTVEKLLREMLVNSDNTAYNMFLRTIDFSDFVSVLADIGVEDLFNDKGFMSAKEYSRIFRALYTSSFLKREGSQFLLSLLTGSEYKEFLVSGVPEELPFAHKFGINSEYRVSLDSGIVYIPHRPYLITVAIQGIGSAGEEEKIKKFMKTVAEKTYEYVSER